MRSINLAVSYLPFPSTGGIYGLTKARGWEVHDDYSITMGTDSNRAFVWRWTQGRYRGWKFGNDSFWRHMYEPSITVDLERTRGRGMGGVGPMVKGVEPSAGFSIPLKNRLEWTGANVIAAWRKSNNLNAILVHCPGSLDTWHHSSSDNATAAWGKRHWSDHAMMIFWDRY